MRKIYLIISSLSLALMLSACGSGDTIDESGTIEVQVVRCNTNTTTPIESGDTLVKETDDTTVTITDVDETSKAVCVKTGNAKIVR